MTPLFRKFLGLNWPLVFMMYGLLIFGVFSIESAARHLDGGGAKFAELQKHWILGGSLIFLITALVDYRWFRWISLPMWVVSLGLAVMAAKDPLETGQVELFGFKFQPAQMVLVSGLLLMSWLIQDLPRLGRMIPKIGWILDEPVVKVGVIGIVSGTSFLIIMAAKDMGSAIVWIPLSGIALLISGVPFRYLSFMSLVAIAAVPLAYFVVLPKVSKRGKPRIDTFLDMVHERSVNVSGDAYAAEHCRIAVGKAGWAGEGLNAANSLHAQRFIPFKTAHNDYIFAVIAEEQGFRGSILLITSFGLLLVLCLFIGAYARDPMGRLLIGGVVAAFFAHIFENIGMCITLMPITGIPLPLISYSGTFVLVCMFMLGLVQSVWVHRDSDRLREEAAAA